MRPRLCRTTEGLFLHPGETVRMEQPLVGCFVTAAVYGCGAVVTHCGPGMNETTDRYHRALRPSPLTPPLRLIVLSLDLDSTTHWDRRRDEYRSLHQGLIALLAASFQIAPETIERAAYASGADVTMLLSDEANLAIQGLSGLK